MTAAAWFVFGLFMGWLIEWMIDHLYWRRNRFEHQQDRERELSIREAALQGRERLVAEEEARLAKREAELKALQHSALAASLPPQIHANPRSAFITASGEDDLEAIEGVGPKIASLLRQAGIETFAQRAGTPVLRLQTILGEAGPHFAMAKPDTWPEQAELLVRHEFDQFEALKRSLMGGVRPHDSGASLS
jgi:predicted flap endonuclease-1-like 5' DNA nuclease